MDFISFARLHGILIEHLPPIGRWKRLPTEDHPHKKNGAVKYMGDHGFVQNHATMVNVEAWRPDDADRAPNIDHAVVQRQIEAEAKKRADEQRLAARKAAWILNQTTLESHEYLAARGFPEVQGNVWRRTDKEGTLAKLLVIPMRVDGDIVGCQLIGEDGKKKFLTGQRTRDAVFVIDNKGRPILCEGYAKALAVRVAMAALKQRYRIIVAFSAFNMSTIAKTLPDCFIIADRDSPSPNAPAPGGMGLKVATESGRPFWISDIEGEDFDVYLARVGVFRASQALRLSMQSKG